MVIQFADYCDKRAEKTFDLLMHADYMLENQRSRLVRILKQCQRVKRLQCKLGKPA